MTFQNEFTRSLNLKFPLVMAPMFLASNEAMIHEGIESGILACFPSQNFRKTGELNDVLQRLNEKLIARKGSPGNYGVNLIVQKTNSWFEEHLEVCVRNKVPLIITSLGNPEKTIKAVHEYGGKVFCDVTNLTYAEKCMQLRCDGFIAVGQGAGGHAGPHPLHLFIEALRNNYPGIPVLAAGGIANGKAILGMLAFGASAAYCGTRFIATTESPVSADYKNAILKAGMDDIVMTERISGTPLSIINTDFAQKIGKHQNFFERYMSRNPNTKKYFKTLVQRRGWNWLEEAVKPGNYHNLWCAGESVELIDDIVPVKVLVERLIRETEDAFREINSIRVE